MLLDKNIDEIQKVLETQTPLLNKEKLAQFVGRFLKLRERYLDIFKKKGSPLYLIDQEAISRNANQFKNAFLLNIPRAKFYYAMKSNNHPFLISALIKEGFNVDVSSGKELVQALKANPPAMIFSGPGKTYDELILACENADRVIVLCDSFGELKRLQEVASERNIVVRAGLRLMIEENGLWRKFGIPLRRMGEFFKEAQECSHVDLCGLQFHASWNLDTSKPVGFLKLLGKELEGLSRSYRDCIKFVDIGGGYWPTDGEWMQPSATPEGKLKACIEPQITEGLDHRCLESLPIEQYAQQIGQALEQNLFPYVDCDIFLEPGRWISHESMHILLKVMDKKAEDVVITDGGTNIVGWDRYETDYFPLINLSRPSLTEHSCMVFGSLCTPHDLWGYNYFGEGIEADDILLVPNQGAYTYSLRQEFIKDLPSCEVF